MISRLRPGLCNYYSVNTVFRAERGKALEAATRLSRVTDRIGDAALSRTADMLMGSALVLLGRPREAQEFLERHPQAGHAAP